MKTSILFIVCLFAFQTLISQPYLITKYQVDVSINKDASVNVVENLDVEFKEPRHGIIRKIPFRYDITKPEEGGDRAALQMVSSGRMRTIVEDIEVPTHPFSVSTEGDYKAIKIGSPDKYAPSSVHYTISYKVLNVINFFNDHAEFYFNLIGNQWDTYIDSAAFSIRFFAPVKDTSALFLATGSYGSREKSAIAEWKDNQTIIGHTLQTLNPGEGLTVGVLMPADYLDKPNYALRGIMWLLLPLAVFIGMLLFWKRFGKDEKRSVQTEFYPPENMSPSEAGYLIDNRLNRRDLTALVPYWGANGFLQINELENKALLGLIKIKDYEFVKLKDLPSIVPTFEKTMFKGIFKTGDKVLLSSLKNVLYEDMNKAKQQLQSQVDKDRLYVKYSRGLSIAIPVAGIILLILSFQLMIFSASDTTYIGIALIASAIIIIIFGLLMKKKTKKGTDLFYKLLGFKEFIQTVEKDRLETFLKQDPNYFDKVLPFAIVFNVADQWKDKLKGLDVPPPQWYNGYYPNNAFTTYAFMNSLDRSLNTMSSNFYSSPPSSSGGSFSGGGGFSGGGFGGGGGSSW